MSYRGRYYDERDEQRGSSVAGMVGWGLIGLIVLAVIAGMGYLVWLDIRAQYTTAPAQAAATQAPAIAPVAPVVTPRVIIQQAPVIVQQVPAGQAPQPVMINAPVQAPQPVMDSSGAVVEQPVPAPIIIVHQTSADGTHQTITGSGACKVGGSVAKRCAK